MNVDIGYGALKDNYVDTTVPYKSTKWLNGVMLYMYI